MLANQSLLINKLVTSIKSPYMNQAVIEGLNKAYRPGKIRRNKKSQKKKKSSTPNIKFRKHQKEIRPVLKQEAHFDSKGLNEIIRLRMEKDLEEEKVMKKQKENIERLKILQAIGN